MATKVGEVALTRLQEDLLGRVRTEAKICPMVSISLVRMCLGAGKRQFDNALLELVRFGYLDIHRTDIPRRLMTTYEREGFLWVGEDTAYNACSVRKGGRS